MSQPGCRSWRPSLQARSRWAILIGNIVGIAAMALRVNLSHPALAHQIRNTVNVKV